MEALERCQISRALHKPGYILLILPENSERNIRVSSGHVRLCCAATDATHGNIIGVFLCSQHHLLTASLFGLRGPVVYEVAFSVSLCRPVIDIQ